MSYGTLASAAPRLANSPRNSQALKAIFVGLALISASCLVAMHLAKSSVSLAGPLDVNQMEVNAYLTSSESAEFKNLLAEQTLITSRMPSLLAQEAKMKAEDTKVITKRISQKTSLLEREIML